MLKRILNETSKFDYYFREADGDEGDSVSVKVVPRENRGTDYNDDSTNVSVAPRANRGTDYNNDEGDTSSDNTDSSSEEPSTSNDNTDDTNDSGNDNNESDTGNEPDTGDGDDYNDDSSGESGDDTGNEPDTGDDGTDYNDDSESDDGEDTSDDTSDESDGQNQDNSKKYSLYLRYLKLYDMIDSFVEKIQAVIKDDPSQNAVINKVVDNLNDLHDGMYEYMTIKFMAATYVEAVIYFETVVNCIRLNFELLRNNKINLKQ